ncbi:hypothetical protein F4680DRAFT_433955 [Xylaria scruposa]|nr:hypothetical protein F4680DRAFT_433955 [Xylaria scruposa]
MACARKLLVVRICVSCSVMHIIMACDERIAAQEILYLPISVASRPAAPSFLETLCATDVLLSKTSRFQLFARALTSEIT